MRPGPLTLALLASLAASAAAEGVRLSALFGSSMVLQRDEPLALWGFAAPGVVVTGAMDGGASLPPATAGADGVWRIALAAHAADSDGATHYFNFTASDGSACSMDDVAFGDVFVAGGQSNMTFDVNQALNSTAEEASADAFAPWLRVFTVQPWGTDEPQLDLNASKVTPWARVSSSTIGGFSAIGFFFARGLHLRLLGEKGARVPIGVVCDAIGGTGISLWAPEVAKDACANASDVPYPGPQPNGQGYNAMIAPFATGPTRLAGFLYYQAEADAPPYGDSPVWYACVFEGLISSWRALVAPDTPPPPFMFVQLAPFAGPDDWESIRQAQLAGLLQPNVGFATMVDNGDTGSPYGTYHPRNKQLIAARLVTVALSLRYGLPHVWRGPQLAAGGATFSPPAADGSVTVTATFDFVRAGGLVSVPAECPTSSGVVNASMCADFSIFWKPAPAPITSFLGVGFLAAGADIPGGGEMTVAAATAHCTASDVCRGFTFMTNDTVPSPSASYKVLFKSAVNFISGAAGWLSFGNDRDVRGQRGPAAGSIVGGDGGSSLKIVGSPPSAGQRAAAAGYAWATWPVTPIYAPSDGVDAPLPMIPWFATAE